MSAREQSEAGADYAFYGAQYARFGSRLAAEVRREAYGEDLGQQGWRTLDEQVEIMDLLAAARPAPHLLDIACGSGGPSLAIAASTGCRLTGVDIESAGIAEAKGRATALGLGDRATFIVADCSGRLPFDDGAFDVAVCIDAILHLEHRFSALAEWFRLLRPAGALLITDAAVLTGEVSKHEIDVRASQGAFVFVPPGLNEKAISETGFLLRRTLDTTPAMGEIAHRLHTARKARSEDLRKEEGADWFEKRQSFLSTVAAMAISGRLSRFLYVAEKPL